LKLETSRKKKQENKEKLRVRSPKIWDWEYFFYLINEGKNDLEGILGRKKKEKMGFWGAKL